MMTTKHWIADWEGPGLSFEGSLTALCDGGECVASEDGLRIKNAHTVTFVFSGATSFVNYRDISGDPSERNRQNIALIAGRPYEEVLNEHVEEHSALFNRVSLTLGDDDGSCDRYDPRKHPGRRLAFIHALKGDFLK